MMCDLLNQTYVRGDVRKSINFLPQRVSYCCAIIILFRCIFIIHNDKLFAIYTEENVIKLTENMEYH